LPGTIRHARNHLVARLLHLDQRLLRVGWDDTRYRPSPAGQGYISIATGVTRSDKLSGRFTASNLGSPLAQVGQKRPSPTNAASDVLSASGCKCLVFASQFV
jgi:hypothetical protein